MKVVDEMGNISHVMVNDLVESNIPGSNVYRIGNTTSIFVSNSQSYKIDLSGYADDELAELRLRFIDRDEITKTLLYDDIPIRSGSLATVEFDPASSQTPDLSIDLQNDGVIDDLRQPTAILNAAGSTDSRAPTSQITIEYLVTDNLIQARIEISATDDVSGTGISHIQYSFDGLETVQEYTSPIIVNLTDVTKIWVKAIDLAGNEQYPLTEVTISRKVFLPITRS